MLQTVLSRVLSAPDSPTADLYFRNACPDFIGNGVEQFAPTVFASATTCVVMRHDMRVGRLPARRRLVYLLDDDVIAGTSDASLPYLYRQKLRLVEEPAGRRFSRLAGTAVVSSPAIAKMFNSLTDTHIMRPYWSEAFAPLGHFKPLYDGEGWIDMAFLGSAVHRADLQFILPVVQRLLTLHPRLRFHLPERHRLAPEFERHPRVCRIPGLGWSAYRREISTRQFHVALYPLLDHPFNRARSLNKIIEHAVIGAAPVYSSGWIEAPRISHGDSGLCLRNDAESWFHAVDALLCSPERMHTIAREAQRLAATLNTPEPQRALWRMLLDLEEPAFA